MSDAVLTARFVRPVVKLSAKLEKPGGISREVALARARDGLESLRADFLAEIGARIAQLNAAMQAAPERAFVPSALFEDISAVHSLAGSYDLKPLERGAELFLFLIGTSEEDRTPAGLARLFVDALQKLWTGLDGHTESELFDHLQQLMDHYRQRQHAMGSAVS